VLFNPLEGRFVESIAGVDLSQNSCLSTEMLREFSFLELRKEAATDNMTSMLDTSTFTQFNALVCMGVVWHTSQPKCKMRYADEAEQFNKPSVRLIGAQASALACFSY
jgi:hypothetical protein